MLIVRQQGIDVVREAPKATGVALLAIPAMCDGASSAAAFIGDEANRLARDGW